MTSFQERFKGKTSTISKEGVIPSLDKPPISKGYIQKDPQFQQQERQQATSNYSQKSSNYGGSSRGNQSTSSNPSTYSPMSNPYVLQDSKNTSQQVKGYGNQGIVIKQQQSNSNFSTRSEQSNKSKVSINQKVQQPQYNDPYFVNNPFDLDMISLNNVSGNGNQQKLQQSGQNKLNNTPSQQQYISSQNIGKNSYSGPNSQVNKSYDFINSQESQQKVQFNQNSVSNGLIGDNALAASKTKIQPKTNKISAYTLEKNTKSPQNTTGQSNMSTQGTGQNPYHNYNPYTLDSIENINQKPGQKGKNSSSPDIRRNNNRVLQQSQNNLINQEEEASIYVQSYVPSFAQHVSTDNTKQSEQGNSNGLTNLNNSKKNTINDYPALLQQRGGLGANLGTDEWNSKKEKFDKMQEYSAQVKYFNQQQQVNLPPSNQRRPKKEEEKKVSSRDKALEFSKNIPKPKQKTEQSVTQESSNKNQSYNNQQYSESSPTSNSNTNNNTNTLKSYKSGSNDYQNQDEIDFEALERQHLEYLNKIERLNLN